MSWTQGYPTEIDYSTGYYPELSPIMLRFACLNAGVVLPPIEQLNYLELGFGRGVSLNIHAAACDARVWGNDFNPNHVAQANALRSAAGTDAKLLDDSFAELLHRPDLPEFDAIVLHGIWSWVSPQNRDAIVEILRRKLKVGGIVYVSYNANPGWAPAAPFRNLVALYAETQAAGANGVAARVDRALDSVRALADVGASYFRQTPSSLNALGSIAHYDKNYVVHEYTSKDWHLMDFREVAQALRPAKLEFLTSARTLDSIASLNLSPEQQELLTSLQDSDASQVTQDFMANRQFRADIFVKGARRLNNFELEAALLDQMFALLRPADEIGFTIRAPRGEATLDKRVHGPLIAAMALDNSIPKTLRQLAESPLLEGVSVQELAQAVALQVGAGNASPARLPSAATLKHCAALNRFLCHRARSNMDIPFLVSPIVARGVMVGRIEQLFVLAKASRAETSNQYAEFVWRIFESQGQRLSRDGQVLERPDENISELERQAAKFIATSEPLLRALGIGELDLRQEEIRRQNT